MKVIFSHRWTQWIVNAKTGVVKNVSISYTTNSCRTVVLPQPRIRTAQLERRAGKKCRDDFSDNVIQKYNIIENEYCYSTAWIRRLCSSCAGNSKELFKNTTNILLNLYSLSSLFQMKESRNINKTKSILRLLYSTAFKTFFAFQSLLYTTFYEKWIFQDTWFGLRNFRIFSYRISDCYSLQSSIEIKINNFYQLLFTSRRVHSHAYSDAQDFELHIINAIICMEIRC